MNSKHCFLLGQPIWRAVSLNEMDRWDLAIRDEEPSDDRNEHLGFAIRHAPWNETDVETISSPTRARESGARWRRIDSRDRVIEIARATFPRRRPWRRVGLVCGAGLGKTTNLQWLCDKVNRARGYRGPQLAYFRELTGLPRSPKTIFDEILKDIVSDDSESAIRVAVRRMLVAGQVTFLFDSLDQANPDPRGEDVQALVTLCQGPWKACPVWVSGRPYAFQIAREALELVNPVEPWQFLRIGPLDEPECRQLLETTHRNSTDRVPAIGKQRYDDLADAGKRLARIPRYGRLIALLPSHRFEGLTSESATYFEIYRYVRLDQRTDHLRDGTGILDDALSRAWEGHFGWHKAEPPVRDESFRRWQVDLAMLMLAAIAFQMFVEGQGRPSFAITTEPDQFLNRALDRFLASGVYQSERGKPIDDDYVITDWKRLRAADAIGLKHLVFSASDKRLQWTDISAQAFFAAYWACRLADDKDRNVMCGWVPDPLNDMNLAYEEYWRMAADMPDEAIDRDHWVSLFSPLYDGSLVDNQSRPIRSTELIYRTWCRMRNTMARAKFQSEFSAILNGEHGREQCATARQLLCDSFGTSQLLRLCRGERGKNDTGLFLMGAPDGECPEADGEGAHQRNPVHRVRLSPYYLHRYCVTDAEYELFDPRHADQRKFEDQVADLGRHPVVMVSWYDAWCFTTWLGNVEVPDGTSIRLVLPTEAQWEYACRAGSDTPFTWNSDRDGNKNEASDSNFHGRFPWPWDSAKEGTYRERTIPVDGLDSDGSNFPPNPWGFCQMHGNVGEWCWDWFDPNYYRLKLDGAVCNPAGPARASCRVIRGGGLVCDAGLCRSSFRDSNWASTSAYFLGFRLAAVPLESRMSGD